MGRLRIAPNTPENYLAQEFRLSNADGNAHTIEALFQPKLDG